MISQACSLCGIRINVESVGVNFCGDSCEYLYRQRNENRPSPGDIQYVPELPAEKVRHTRAQRRKQYGSGRIT